MKQQKNYQHNSKFLNNIIKQHHIKTPTPTKNTFLPLFKKDENNIIYPKLQGDPNMMSIEKEQILVNKCLEQIQALDFAKARFIPLSDEAPAPYTLKR